MENKQQQIEETKLEIEILDGEILETENNVTELEKQKEKLLIELEELEAKLTEEENSDE